MHIHSFLTFDGIYFFTRMISYINNHHRYGTRKKHVQKQGVSVVGMTEVGKASIISRMVNGVFPCLHLPMFKEVSLMQRNYTFIQFHNTSGISNSYAAALRNYPMQLCEIIVYVYCWDNPWSLRWLRSPQRSRGVACL
jgi:hypothetical protein